MTTVHSVLGPGLPRRRPSADTSAHTFHQTGKPRPKAELLTKSLRGPGDNQERTSLQSRVSGERSE